MKKDIKTAYIFDLMKRKDPVGFDLLYKIHFRKMYGIAYNIFKQDDLCHDTIQNVMLKLFRLEEELYPTSHELTWLYTVVRNEALQLLRKDKSNELMGNQHFTEGSHDNIENFVDMESYHDLLTDLNDIQREVITLKVLGGFTHKEIAKLLGKPIGTIQWTYNTSIKKLRGILSAMVVLVVTCSTTFAYKWWGFMNKRDGVPVENVETISKVETLDFWLVLLGATSLILTILLILIYRKSDKIFKIANKS